MQKKLYDMYCGRFYAFCLRYTEDEFLAQEVLSEGFLTVFESVGKYRGDGSFEGWMRMIFLRKALRKCREERRKQKLFEDSDGYDVVGENNDYGRQMDLRNVLVEALRRLPAKERAVFNMVTVDGYTFKAVAAFLKEPESTVKSWFYKAKKTMQEIIVQRLGKDFMN